MTSHSFSYCEHFCSQRFFFYSCSARSCPFLHLPSKLLSFFSNKIKIKKMQHYSKRSSFAEKVLFSKKKRRRSAFFCCCSARSPRSCPSGRFSLLLASRCSFKILLQYPWKLQRFAYKKPNLAAVWPGPKAGLGLIPARFFFLEAPGPCLFTVNNIQNREQRMSKIGKGRYRELLL